MNMKQIFKARRRVQMRSALVLTFGAAVLCALGRLAGGLPAAGAGLALGALCTQLAFGGAAYLGLCVLDGDHRHILPMRHLSREQLLFLSLTGVLAVCPAALAADLSDALFGLRETGAAGALPIGLFTAQLVKSAVLVPICEEIFFRGYLLHAFRRVGDVRASAAVTLCFALMHTVSPGTLAAHGLLGALLCLLTLKTGSLLAPVVVHASYNAALLVLGYAGLGALFAGWSLAACVVRLLGCAAFMAALQRAYRARGVNMVFELWPQGALKKREMALLAAAGVLLLAIMVAGG